MTRAIQPRAITGGVLTPFVLLGLVWAALGLLWLAWAAGRFTAAVLGRDPGPGFGARFTAAVLHADWATAWPGLPAPLVVVVLLILVCGAVAPVAAAVLWWRLHRPAADDPLPALAGPADVRAMTLSQVAGRARRLRPSLADRPARAITAPQAGVLLGVHRRRGCRSPNLYASWEDVLLAVMAPRAGKTTALAVPAVLHAPGPVIATSNKADLWATTTARRATVGRVWVFDPQAITSTRQSWWWDPLATVTTVEDANRLAEHFVQQIRSAAQQDDFWTFGALDLLTALILAAASQPGGTLLDVQRWLSDSTSREPGVLLKEHGFAAAARALAGRQAGAPETREGIYETARTAAACLANPDIMAWVMPPHPQLPTLDVSGFAATTDTVYLLSKDGAGNAAPLVAGLTDQLLRHGVHTAERQGGRLDPGLLAVLDEAANICKIRDLPELYSHLGSRGIVALTILQSRPQGMRVWGEQGMHALWSAATIKLVGAGIDDPHLAEDLSRLVGEHDVTLASHTRDGRGTSSWQTSTRRQRILDAAQVRALPRGSALLLATGVKVALIDLVPWYDGPLAAQLGADVAAAEAALTAAARADAPDIDVTDRPRG